jgi:hypothetical protein
MVEGFRLNFCVVVLDQFAFDVNQLDEFRSLGLLD